MSLGILEPMLQRLDLLLLLFMRTMGLFATAPIWSNRLVPVQLRVALAFATAMVIFPLFTPPVMPPTLLGLAPMALQELLVGMIIGFVSALTLAAVQLAGQLLDLSMGISIANVLDPATNTQMPILGNFLYILAILVFFTINGHHVLLQSIMDSYVLVPVGKVVMTTSLSEAMVGMAGNLFILGFKIAAPVLAAVFLTTVALGILNRAVPQMNVFVVGLPVQLAMGIFILMVVLPLYVTFLQVVFRGMFDDILRMLQLLKG